MNKKRPYPSPKPTQHSREHTKPEKRPPFWGSRTGGRRMAGRVDEGWADGWLKVMAGEAMDDGK